MVIRMAAANTPPVGGQTQSQNDSTDKATRPSDDQTRFVDVKFESGDANSLAAAGSSNLAALMGLVGSEAEAIPFDGPPSGAAADQGEAAADPGTDLSQMAPQTDNGVSSSGADSVPLPQSGPVQGGGSEAQAVAGLQPEAAAGGVPGAPDQPVLTPEATTRPASNTSAPVHSQAEAPASSSEPRSQDAPVVEASAPAPAPDPDPVAPTPQVQSGGSVAENSAAGTVVATLDASDADGAVTYTLTDAAGNAVVDPNFEIVGNEIRIKTGADIDFEAADSHGLFVTAQDADATSDPLAVTVSVTDTAEVITLADGGATFTDTGVTEISITGGDGNDAITGSAGNDVLSGAQGDDTVTSAAGDDAITLGAGDDGASAGSGDDTITGGTGNDSIDGGADSDTAIWSGDRSDFDITYDSGTDTFTITDQNATDGDEGTDQVTAVETFIFNGTSYSAGDMQAYAANTAPTDISMTGGSVNETVANGGDIGASHDPAGTVVATLSTSDANAGDTHSYSLVNDPSGAFEIVGNEIRVKAGQTVDYETHPSIDLTVRSTDQFGATYDEVLTINVQDYEASYTTSSAGETVTGTSEEDILIGGSGIDALYGGDGNDTLIDGKGGHDTLDGGEGSDIIILNSTDYAISNIVTDTGISGTDTLAFGNGAGTYRVQSNFSAATSGIEVISGSANLAEDFGTRDATANFDLSDITLVDVDRIIGTNGDDRIIGSAGDDHIAGDDGNDLLQGYEGDDSIEGEDGNDTIQVSDTHGTDTISGGDGFDVLEFLGAHGVEVTVTDDGEGDYAYTSGGAAEGTFSEIERMILSDGADLVDGSGDTDGLDIAAGAGDDTLTLGSGDDVIVGESGSDTFLVGSQEGADTIDGGAGGGWTDAITLDGMGNSYSINGDTVDGDGWTMVLESGDSVISDSAGVLQLSQDASGMITFDDGGTIDFSGIEQVNF